MANPLHNLEDGLQRLRRERDGIKTELKSYTKMLVEVETDILKFEKSIDLLKKGE